LLFSFFNLPDRAAVQAVLLSIGLYRFPKIRKLHQIDPNFLSHVQF
jgi:hypothetical protein